MNLILAYEVDPSITAFNGLIRTFHLQDPVGKSASANNRSCSTGLFKRFGPCGSLLMVHSGWSFLMVYRKRRVVSEPFFPDASHFRALDALNWLDPDSPGPLPLIPHGPKHPIAVLGIRWADYV